MAELDHRVKNVLAAVQALAQQTAKRTTSLDAFLQTFGGRLKAMASANELLTAARWRGAAIDHLAAAELGALAPGQTRWEGPELFLTPRAANALSLALHELATNAVKFGALSVETGHVDVRWTRAAGRRLRADLDRERRARRSSAPARRGFGSTLLEQVTGRELNGETAVEYRPGRRRACGCGPAPQAVAARPETVPEAPAAAGHRDRHHLQRPGQPEGRAGADRRGRGAAGAGAGDRPLRSRRRGGRARPTSWRRPWPCWTSRSTPRCWTPTSTAAR